MTGGLEGLGRFRRQRIAISQFVGIDPLILEIVGQHSANIARRSEIDTRIVLYNNVRNKHVPSKLTSAHQQTLLL